jgi:hypothetical protein
MPRYFFNFCDHDELYLDEDGQDLDTLALVNAQAELHAADIVSEKLHDGHEVDGHQFDRSKRRRGLPGHLCAAECCLGGVDACSAMKSYDLLWSKVRRDRRDSNSLHWNPHALGKFNLL